MQICDEIRITNFREGGGVTFFPHKDKSSEDYGETKTTEGGWICAETLKVDNTWQVSHYSKERIKDMIKQIPQDEKLAWRAAGMWKKREDKFSWVYCLHRSEFQTALRWYDVAWTCQM